VQESGSNFYIQFSDDDSNWSKYLKFEVFGQAYYRGNEMWHDGNGDSKAVSAVESGGITTEEDIVSKSSIHVETEGEALNVNHDGTGRDFLRVYESSIGSTSGNNAWRFRINPDGAFEFEAVGRDSPNADFLLNTGGSLGVGTKTPSYAADVAGTVRAQDALRVATSNGDYELQGDGNGNLEILTPGGNRQVLFDGGDIGAFQ
jgi:hypothetical protein